MGFLLLSNECFAIAKGWLVTAHPVREKMGAGRVKRMASLFFHLSWARPTIIPLCEPGTNMVRPKQKVRYAGWDPHNIQDSCISPQCNGQRPPSRTSSLQNKYHIIIWEDIWRGLAVDRPNLPRRALFHISAVQPAICAVGCPPMLWSGWRNRAT